MKEIKIDFNFLEMLTIVFIVFKILGYITWNWIWVLSPLWIGGLVAIILIVIIKRIL
jgi:hypothetical protein